MQWSDIPRSPSRRVLRQFAGLWIVVFGGLAVRQWFSGSDHAVWLGLLAVTVGAAGLARPAIVGPVFVGWLMLVFPIGWLVSRLTLALLYFGVLTPLGLLFRLMGREVLYRQPEPARESYWTAKTTGTRASSYLRQY
jgi:hypothetical protein